MTASRGRLIDVSHTIEHGMAPTRAFPRQRSADWLSRDASQTRYAAGTTFQIGKIELLANTGTYIDAPFHRYEGGKDVAAYPLEAVATSRAAWSGQQSAPAGRSMQVCSAAATCGARPCSCTRAGRPLAHGALCTGHPFLTRAAAEHLIAAGRPSWASTRSNIDDAADGARPAHTLLLGAAIPIVEHLCGLRGAARRRLPVLAVPVKVRGWGAFRAGVCGSEDDSNGAA